MCWRYEELHLVQPGLFGHSEERSKLDRNLMDADFGPITSLHCPSWSFENHCNYSGKQRKFTFIYDLSEDLHICCGDGVYS